MPAGRVDRRYPRQAAGDQRNPFQQDRDRILYSTALRRLAGITQVVGAAEGHVFHNRLTHTLEVAQLARRLAEKLAADTPDLAHALGGVEPEVAEAAALAHDLGHPPFGHVAEQELDYQVAKAHRVRDGFEGNAQTFRIITKVSVRYADSPGQNLTRATLNATLKYPWRRGPWGHRHKKYGAYSSERDDFLWARGAQPPSAAAEKSPEAEVMDWADDIAYAVHDMEDFYRAGFIPLDRLMDEGTGELDRFIDGTFARWATDFRPVKNHTDDQLRDAVGRLFEQLRATQNIGEPYTGSLDQRAHLRGLTSVLIRRYVVGDVGQPAPITLRQPAGKNKKTVEITPAAEREIAMLKQLTWYYVIQRPSLAGQQLGQRKVIRDLFEVFFDATRFTRTRDRLPVWAQQSLERGVGRATPNVSLRVRIAADVICSLSEQQAIALHQQVTGLDPGSILSRILA